MRIAFVTEVTFSRIANDATYFRTTAANLANGKGYVLSSFTHPVRLVPTAAHPPLYPALLSIFDIVGLRSIADQRIALAIMGSSAVFVMGLLGRKVAGPVVGIVAAAIGALDPLRLQPIGSLMSEGIYLLIIPFILLLALRCLEEPTILRFGIFGVVMALAVLVRSEALDFVVLTGVPLLLFSSVPWIRRGLLGLGLLVGLTLILAPWVIRNERVNVGLGDSRVPIGTCRLRRQE